MLSGLVGHRERRREEIKEIVGARRGRIEEEEKKKEIKVKVQKDIKEIKAREK